MREIRPSGSEGGGAGVNNRPSLPLSGGGVVLAASVQVGSDVPDRTRKSAELRLEIDNFRPAATIPAFFDQPPRLGEGGAVAKEASLVESDVGEEKPHRASFGDFRGFVQIGPRSGLVALFEPKPRPGQQTAGEIVELASIAQAGHRFFDFVLGGRERARSAALQKRPVEPSATEVEVVEGDAQQIQLRVSHPFESLRRSPLDLVAFPTGCAGVPPAPRCTFGRRE